MLKTLRTHPVPIAFPAAFARFQYCPGKRFLDVGWLERCQSLLVQSNLRCTQSLPAASVLDRRGTDSRLRWM